MDQKSAPLTTLYRIRRANINWRHQGKSVCDEYEAQCSPSAFHSFLLYSLRFISQNNVVSTKYKTQEDTVVTKYLYKSKVNWNYNLIKVDLLLRKLFLFSKVNKK